MDSPISKKISRTLTDGEKNAEAQQNWLRKPLQHLVNCVCCDKFALK